MIVIDASVLVNGLTDDDRLGELAWDALSADPDWASPEHMRIEAFAVIRKRYLAGRVASGRADEAVAALEQLTITTAPFEVLAARTWSLRDRVSGYDAPYVAMAEAFDAGLVTCDRRLVKAAVGVCRATLVTAVF